MDQYRIQNDDGDMIPLSLEGLKNSFIQKSHEPCVFVSAANRTNVEELRTVILDNVRKQYAVRYPYAIV